MSKRVSESSSVIDTSDHSRMKSRRLTRPSQEPLLLDIHEDDDAPKRGGPKRLCSRALDRVSTSLDDLDEELHEGLVAYQEHYERTRNYIIEKYTSLAKQREEEYSEVIDTVILVDPGKDNDVLAIDNGDVLEEQGLRPLDDLNLDDETAPRFVMEYWRGERILYQADSNGGHSILGIDPGSDSALSLSIPNRENREYKKREPKRDPAGAVLAEAISSV